MMGAAWEEELPPRSMLSYFPRQHYPTSRQCCPLSRPAHPGLTLMTFPDGYRQRMRG